MLAVGGIQEDRLMCFHRFGKWEDVAISEKPLISNPYTLFFHSVHVIRQQRRCVKCNLVQTRTS
jgi:hypothetical protein